MQTPLQKLIEQLEEKISITKRVPATEPLDKEINNLVINTLQVSIISAKSLLPYEEQVIKDAYNVGYNNGYLDTALKPQEYYNERFNQIK